MNPSRQLPDLDRGRDTLEAWQLECGAPRGWVFWIMAGFAATGLAALPLVQVNLTVRAAGFVRPVEEPVEVRAPVSGVIARVLVRDNSTVQRDEPLCEIAAPEIDERRRHLARRRAEVEGVLADLGMLLKQAPNLGVTALGEEVARGEPELRTPLGLSEHAQLQAALATQAGERARLVRELERAERLHAKGLLPDRELEATRFALRQRESETGAMVAQTRARWETQRRQSEREIADVLAEENTLAEGKARRTVCAATAGDLLGFTGLKPGAFVGEGQPLGSISPEGTLRIEATVRSRDLALLRRGQLARVEFEAFPAAECGFLDGTVEILARDIQWAGATPYHRLFVSLPGGRGTAAPLSATTIQPRKGMTATVRVVVGRRSLWHYLTESADRWLEVGAGTLGGAGPNSTVLAKLPPTSVFSALRVL